MPGLWTANGRVRPAAVLGGPGRAGAGGHAMRFREDGPQELARARAAVMDWRDRTPAGTAWQLAAELGAQFHPDYGRASP